MEGRLANVESQLAQLRAHMDEGFRATQTAIRELDNFLRGTPERPGLQTRVALLEATDARRRWALRALVAAVFTAVAEACLLLVTATKGAK